MNKVYERINWENYPSEGTPINEDNLNRMDNAIDAIDMRVVDLDSNKQNALNFDSTPTQNSTNPVTSGGIYEAIATLERGLDWKESVATYNDIATTYPNPEDGWTVTVKDTDQTYKYNGSAWINIFGLISVVTTTKDGLMSASDKAKLDGISSQANKTEVTQELTSGKKIATVSIDGTPTDLYVESIGLTNVGGLLCVTYTA